MLASLTPLPVPVDLRELVRQRLQDAPVVVLSKQRSPWRFFLPRLAPMAAAVLVTVLGLNLMPGYIEERNLTRSSLEAPGIMRMAPAESPDPEAPPPESSEASSPDTESQKQDDAQTFSITADTNHGSIEIDGKIAGEGTNLSTLSLVGEEPRTVPFWVKTSAGGTIVFFLWGGLVYYWYTKH